MSTPQDYAEQLLSAVAERAGVKIDALELVQLGAQLAGYAADIVSAKAWRAARAAGEAAAANVTTPDEAERLMRAK